MYGRERKDRVDPEPQALAKLREPLELIIYDGVGADRTFYRIEPLPLHIKLVYARKRKSKPVYAQKQAGRVDSGLNRCRNHAIARMAVAK